MTKFKPVLGRGLESLIPRTPPPVSVSVPAGRSDDGMTDDIVAHIELRMIHPNPYQPRADFDPVALDELRRSIQEKGVIQPVTVRRVEGGYQLISGERRVRASRDAGLERIPAYIIHVAGTEEMLELALIENLQREHLNPVEIAISYRRLLEECNYTQEQVAERIGKDRSTIANFLRLLKLPEPIQSALRHGKLDTGHARALISIEDPVLQMEIFQRAIDAGLSVREVERWAKRRRRPGHRSHAGAPPSADRSSLAHVEDMLRQAYGTKVEVRALSEGKGHIAFEYYSPDDLERLLELLLSVQPNQR
jgi:ParB family transcriptional regulator, chromosome partitioning protein